MPVKRADKTPMPTREAQARAHDFEEVNEGYCFSHAMFEAERCLRCQDAICVEGCPVRIPIPDFIHAIATGDMAEVDDDCCITFTGARSSHRSSRAVGASPQLPAPCPDPLGR